MQYVQTSTEIIHDSKAKSFKQRFPFKIIDVILSIHKRKERKILVSKKEFMEYQLLKILMNILINIQ